MENINKLNKILGLITLISGIRKVPQFLFYSNINLEATIKIRKNILNFKRKKSNIDEIDFIINSPGGSANEAYKIIRTLRENFKTVNIIVPFWAKSAATLLSLGGSKIIMDEFGEFGPLDVQIRKEREDSPDYEPESALIDEKSLEVIEDRLCALFAKMFISLRYSTKHIRIKKDKLSRQIFNYISKVYVPLLKQIDPYKLGDKKRKLDIGEQYAKRILVRYSDNILKETKDELVNFLINQCPDHGYIIDYDVISRFLPNVEKSEFFGDEYKNKLTRLSNLLILDIMEESKSEFVGFVPVGENEEKSDDAKIEKIEE